jgi:NitT/TauT family transport system substrate-binding protein
VQSSSKISGLGVFSCLFSFVFLFPLMARVDAQGLSEIRIGSTSPSITGVPIEIAIRRGFFRDEGLSARTIVIRSADIINKALIARQVDYSTSLASLATAAVKGLPIKIVGIIVKKSAFVMVADPSIQSMRELKGKVVGIASYGGAADYVVRIALQKSGLDPKRDVTILQVGGSAARLSALKGGTIQATVLGAPYDLVAQKMGYRSLLWLGKLVDLPQGGLGTYDQKLRENPDEVVRTLKAVDRGIQFIRARREETVRLMMDWLNLDANVADGAYKILIDSLADFAITDDNVVESALEAAKFQDRIDRQIPLNQLRDWSFARRAQAELQVTGRR